MIENGIHRATGWKYKKGYTKYHHKFLINSDVAVNADKISASKPC